ncbi:MAG: ComF family protein [Gammaproteobacteria bacterium]|nr:ComF family protein [Gammaproteobacteria bacterium]
MRGHWSTLIEGLKPYNWLKISHLGRWLPARCILCATPTAGCTLCDACIDDLPWRLPASATRAPRVQASFDYAFPIIECIGRAKLGGDCGLAREIGGWMATRPVAAAFACDVVVAVPQHWRRAVARGYNQALEMAKPVAAMLGRPVSAGALRRAVGTPQRGLGRRARERNIAGRMTADRCVDGLRVLVIDDVTTTGATFREAERALGAAGAATVVCWAAAAVE